MQSSYLPHQFILLFSTALILWSCGENVDSTNNVPSNTSNITDKSSSSSSKTSSVLCNEGEAFTDGSVTYICSDQKWIKQESSQQCTEGQTFANYICSGGQWIMLEQPTQGSNTSSSTTAPIEHTISSSSSFASIETTISSSTSVKAESSANESFTSSSEAKCTSRYIYVQSAHKIATATSIYKKTEREYIYDVCQNGKLKYPSNICDYAVPGQAVVSEDRVINGISYHVWCYGGIPYFDLACSKEELGKRDTIIVNGKFRLDSCIYSQGSYIWAGLVDNPNIANFSIMTDSRDNKNYRTVKIGSQTWMAENLNYEISDSYCYNDSASYCAKYGRLYPWNRAKYVCPEGYHLPDSTEWAILCAATGGTCEKAVQELTVGNSGFAALLAGIKPEYPQDSALYQAWGRYTGFSIYADFWTNTTAKDYVDNGIHYKRAYYFHIKSSSEGIYASISFGDQSESRSIRCIKD